LFVEIDHCASRTLTDASVNVTRHAQSEKANSMSDRSAPRSPAPQEKKMNEPLPCPLCGGPAYATRTVNGTQMFKVGCPSCGIELKAAWYRDQDQATKDILTLWNTRSAALSPAQAPTLKEALAEYAHKAWSGWMKYLFAQCWLRDGTATIPSEWRARWERQMNTPYAELTEAERESDRSEARDILAIVSAVSPAPAPLKELIAKWRADRIALNLAASTMAHEASKFAWEGQAVGRMDCADELEAVVSALSSQPTTLKEHK
jgi:hypothetical protein